MTYIQMTKQLNETGEQVEFLSKIRDEYFKEDRDSYGMINNIINNIYTYQNYLMYFKEYEVKK